MIGEVYAPSNYPSIDQDPSKSITEKLEIIANSHPTVNVSRLGIFRVTLPFVRGVSAEPFVRNPNILHLHHVDVGDEKLYLHGIGTRLLRATAKYGASLNPSLAGVRAIDADLGLVNTFAKSFGEENIRISLSPHHHYGKGSSEPLEAMFSQQIPEDSKPYRVWEVNAQIDPEQLKNWELPVVEITS